MQTFSHTESFKKFEESQGILGHVGFTYKSVLISSNDRSHPPLQIIIYCLRDKTTSLNKL